MGFKLVNGQLIKDNPVTKHKTTRLNKEVYGYDLFGNEVLIDDEIYMYKEEYFLVSALEQQMIEFLNFLEAKKIRATNTDL